MLVNPGEVADSFVSLEEFPPHNVFVVTFGSGADRYKLMYDNRYTAEVITAALKALVRAALREAVGVGR